MSVNTINNLNEDCLGKIFQYLPIENRLIIENVCRKWKNASKSSAWSDIKEFNCKNNIEFMSYHFSNGFPNSNVFQIILSRCGSVLQTLILNDKFDSTIIPIIHNYCSNLTILQLDLDNYDDKYFINAFTTMNKLKKIQIFNWKKENIENASFSDLKIFHSINVNIENIFFQCSIMGFSQLSINFANTLNKLNCLKYLHLENCNIEKSVMNCITKKQSLTHLSLSRSSWKDANELFSKLINIEYLDLSNNNDISMSLTNKSFQSIINNCKKLQYLNISWCKNLSYSVLKQLKKLEYLNELLVNDTRVDGALLSEFNNLKTLECKNSLKVTDDIVKKILNNSLNIEYLNISMTSVTPNIFTFINNFLQIRKKKLYLIADASILENFDGTNYPDSYLFVNEIPDHSNWF